MQRIIPLGRTISSGCLRLGSRLSRYRAPNTIFWLGFLILNTALFLPAYLLNADGTIFWPTTDADNIFSFLFRLFIWRENLDIFRINLEITFIMAAWLFVRHMRRPIIQSVFLGVYLWMVFYYTYESAMLYLYRANPVFFSDYYMARDGLGFFLENSGLTTTNAIFGLILLATILSLLAVGFRRTLHQITTEQLSRVSKVVLGTFAASGLVLALTFHTVVANPMMVTSSALFKLAENIAASIETYRNLIRLGEIEMEDAYDYSAFTLEHRPDIYLIFIESYGSVLYKRPDYLEQYEKLAQQTHARLHEDGWHVASALSDSPTWGGGSWLAYTSTLFGLHIENHPQFLTLMDRFTLGDEQYPHLPSYLQTQGYQFVSLSSLADQLSEAQWNRYHRFYGYDRLIRYQDLNYTGPHYGWGPSPPDQFALSFAQAEAIDSVDEPTILFFITQNAHFPWAPIPPVLEDWQDFLSMDETEEAEPVDLIEHQALRARYMEAIDYSWEMLTEFILYQGDENALYVILGDHQPPRVSRRSDGLDAPLHIISRDAELVHALTAYGFELDTLFLSDPVPTLRHEGLYSLLVRHLIEYYGTETPWLPPYYEEGFSIFDYFEDISEEDFIEDNESESENSDNNSSDNNSSDNDTGEVDRGTGDTGIAEDAEANNTQEAHTTETTTTDDD